MKNTLKYLLGVFILVCSHAFALPTVAFFYGNNVPVPKLCMYDVVIVDPYSNFDPKDYCNAVSQPFAYVSLGEIPYQAAYKNHIKPQWSIGKNPAWNHNPVLDQTNKEWQDYFLNQLIAPLWDKGYRGFFLDTLDSYFLTTHNAKEQQQQIEGIVYIIKEIKKRYPEAKIILNRGFQLLPYLKNDIYAVVIESLYHGWYQDKKAYLPTPLGDQKFLLNEIDKIKKMNLPVIVIDYLPENQKNRAIELSEQLKKQGLIPWITDKSLQKIYIKKWQAMRRKILIVFSEKKINLGISSISGNNLLNGTIIEYLGYIPEYFNIDAEKELPNVSNDNYAGVIVNLYNQTKEYKELQNWLIKTKDQNVPIVFLANIELIKDYKHATDFGLVFPMYEGSNESLTINKINKKFIGGEMNPPITPYDFFAIRAINSDILLQMKNSNQQLMDAVAITPWGGYALSPYVIEYFPNNSSFWVINPIEFFSKALRLKDFPIPDTTTENGRRLMSVHIDGDGFAYNAKWIGGRTAAEELRDRVLKKYRIPTSFSVITGEISPDGVNPKKSPELMKIARTIFDLPWVQAASHTFSHPFNWHAIALNKDYIYQETIIIKIPHYKFNFEKEVIGSVDFINKYLMPPNKKCYLIFWSGLANPSVAGLALAYQNGILNINGGDQTKIVDHHISLTDIQPMGAEMGGYYQVFAPIEMDYYYMNGFGGPLYGFKNVIQTLKLTDTPRRFKPIDLYYHIYGASYIASLKALYAVYDWALSQPVMNIYISDYIKKVLDYNQASIGKTTNGWMIYTNGDLRELRSSKALGYPDLTTSQNVIGFNEHNNDLYIHLGPGRLTLLNYQKIKPVIPYLIEANARVESFVKNNNSTIIKFKGYMPLKFTLANVNQCKVTSGHSSRKVINKDNTLSFDIDKDSDEIHINC